METLIQNAIPTLGFSVVFLYLLSKLWVYHTGKIQQKDDQIKEMSEKTLEAYRENTKVIQKNTTLTELMYQELRGKNPER